MAAPAGLIRKIDTYGFPLDLSVIQDDDRLASELQSRKAAAEWQQYNLVHSLPGESKLKALVRKASLLLA